MADSHETDGRPHYHSHALSRGLQLVRIVASSVEPTTLAELHSTTGHPKSTLVRLLAVLEDEDYVVRVDERPAFTLGHGVLPIVTAYLASGSLVDLVRPHISKLAHETGWTTNIGMLETGNVFHLCVEYPDRPLRFMATEGTYAEAYCSGLGKALLAGLDDDALDEHLPTEPFPARTERTITTREALRAELDKIRADGYAVDDEENASGLRCVAVPVQWGDEVYGALSVSGATGELAPDREEPLATRLNEVARELTADSRLRSALALLARREGAYDR